MTKQPLAHPRQRLQASILGTNNSNLPLKADNYDYRGVYSFFSLEVDISSATYFSGATPISENVAIWMIL